MAKPKDRGEVETDRSPEDAARARDNILKRMLQTKPKQQRALVSERKAKKRGKS